MKTKMVVASLFFLLITGQLWAGQLETSFTPLIPQGLQFGDSPATIVDKMQRQPDDEKTFPNDVMIYAFDVGIPEEVSEEFRSKGYLAKDVEYIAAFPNFTFYYVFKKSKLVLISMIIADCPDNQNNAKSCYIHKVEGQLDKLYGQPQTVFMRNVTSLLPLGLEITGPFEFKIWEVGNSAIMLSPVFPMQGQFRMKGVEESILIRFARICELKPDGKYDINEY